MQFPTALATSVSVTHENRKKDTTSKEQRGCFSGMGKYLLVLACPKVPVCFDD